MARKQKTKVTRGRRAAPVKMVSNAPATGPSRFTVERFLSAMPKDVALNVRLAWEGGFQVRAAKVPEVALPAVLILAAYARRDEVELVDDYDLLVERMRDAVSDFGLTSHPDLFMASCICILHARGELPSFESFEAIGLPSIYTKLVAH